jgi:putative membrane protein
MFLVFIPQHLEFKIYSTVMLNLKKSEWGILVFTLLYILGFSAYYLSIRNYEFLWYIAVLLIFFVLIAVTLHRSKFDPIILGGLSLWGLLHMAGGGVKVGAGVLYSLNLIPILEIQNTSVLKFDQAVHFFGFAVSTLVVYHLLKPYLNRQTNWKVVYPVIAVAGMGLGAVNEIVEFIAVVSFPETNVGGYANTALDLAFNFLGAVAAIFFIHFYYQKKNPPTLYEKLKLKISTLIKKS